MKLPLPLAFFVLSFAVAELQASDAYYVIVSNERSGNLTVFAEPSHAVVATVPVGKRPRGVRASADGKSIYVALSGSPIIGPPGAATATGTKPSEATEEKATDPTADGIGVVDLATLSLVGKLSAGSDPEQLAVSCDGRQLYVTNEDAAAVSVIVIASGTREHLIPVGYEPEGVETNPTGTTLYVACEALGEIHVIDTVTHQPITRFTVGGRPRTIAFFADGTRALIPSEITGQLHVVDAVRHRVLKTIALPEGSRPMCVQLSKDHRRAFVSTGRGGTICVIDVESSEVRGTIKVGPRPWGIALSPDGRFLYAANGPSNDISVVDVDAGKEIARLPAGKSPWGVVVVQR